MAHKKLERKLKQGKEALAFAKMSCNHQLQIFPTSNKDDPNIGDSTGDLQEELTDLFMSILIHPAMLVERTCSD